MDKIKVFVTVIFSVTNADVKSGKAPRISLSDGFEIPVLGLGTSIRDGDPDDIRVAVELAIEAGYRHFDTAARYGTEELVGRGVRAKVEDGTIQRQDVFITTKVNPHLTQNKLIHFCKERGIQIVAYSPLGSMPKIRFKLNNRPPKRPPLVDDPTITQIGNRYNKTTVQITLRYLLDRQFVPIPKAVTPSYISDKTLTCLISS